MSLTDKQVGVLKGMIKGGAIAVSIVALGSFFNPFGFEELMTPIEKISIAILWSLIPTLFLAVSIGRLAKHRFFTAEDIDGGGLSAGTQQAKLLQSLLQNTFEQTVLAVLVYLAWSVAMPASCLSVIPIAALAFGLGRILFFAGYEKGAPSRAVGFTICFYPSIAMLITIAIAITYQQLS
ncbi:MAPEG family protein [Vibrio superstes]|uniref:MAPEG family protein n=1 Tax=Vibrio superstes NBRC 103154 TaxID=1219062 RepID=A0A511QRG4_9VIBR|nr:MAPEG family protein [Vibrio superstes]GEM79910.1 hypothetical protein VSU01S_21550 [Vibrio superstes NBRC 103154]